jgi:hypothetical protein
MYYFYTNEIFVSILSTGYNVLSNMYGHCPPILFECEALGRIRYSVLGPSGFELETIHQEPIKPLLDLIRKAGIFDEV